ncbi:MAG: Ldh family oxidoreductase [Chloroflexi bacterium]|nr:Ldh family oxidoreductase [Chloroflexota bacterium]
MDERRLTLDELDALAQVALQRAGMPEVAARVVAGVLVEAEARGIESHGLRLLPSYVARIRSGGFNAKAEPRLVREGPAVALLDGQNGLGPLVATRAMEIATAKARAAGIGACAAYNSNHYGAAACYALLAARQGLIGIATTNSVAAVAPPGGRVGRAGNTATAYAVPADEEPPLVLDISMSTAARSRFALHAERGLPLPEGWAIDAEGRPTTDAKAGLGGYLLPLGSPTAGHKGFGLAMLMDTLAGALSGARFGIELQRMTDDDPRPYGIGHFLLAVDPSWFGDPAVFRRRIDRMIRDVRATPAQPGVDRVYAPGERSHAHWMEARQHGIAILAQLEQRMRKLAEASAGREREREKEPQMNANERK